MSMNCPTCDATGFIYRQGKRDRKLHRCPECDGSTHRTDLTPAGSQLVIPGCERDAAPSVKQLDLF